MIAQSAKLQLNEDAKQALLQQADALFEEASRSTGSKESYVLRAGLLLDYGLRFYEGREITREESYVFAKELLNKSNVSRAPRDARPKQENSLAPPVIKEESDVGQDTLYKISHHDLRKADAKQRRNRLQQIIENVSSDEATSSTSSASSASSHVIHPYIDETEDDMQVDTADDRPATTSDVSKEVIDWSLLFALSKSLETMAQEEAEEEEYYDENLAVQIGGETLNLTVLPASGHEHDCFFDALRQVGVDITRERAVTLLLTMAHNEYFRNLVAPEILSLIYEGRVQLPESLRKLLKESLEAVSRSQAEVTDLHGQLFSLFSNEEREVINTSLATFVTALSQMDDLSEEANALLHRLQQAMTNTDEARQNLASTVKQKKVYEAFIRDFIGGRTKPTPGAPYNMMGLVLGNTGTVDAIAELFSIHLQIIQGNRVIRERRPQGANSRIARLRYNGVNHFDGLIEMQGASVTVETESDEVQEGSSSSEPKERLKFTAEVAERRNAIFDAELAKAAKAYEESGVQISLTALAKNVMENYPEIEGKLRSVMDAISRRPSYKNLPREYKAYSASGASKQKGSTEDALRSKAIIEKGWMEAVQECKESNGKRKIVPIELAAKLKEKFPEELTGTPREISKKMRSLDAYKKTDLDSVIFKRPVAVTKEERQQRNDIFDSEIAEKIRRYDDFGEKISLTALAQSIMEKHSQIKGTLKSVIQMVFLRPLYQNLSDEYKANVGARKRKRDQDQGGEEKNPKKRKEK